MAGLVLKDVTKSFDRKTVLERINLELPEGELLVLLGPSGCGKSTLLRLIAGLEEADAGEIHIGDRRVDKLRPKNRNVALVFQNYSLYPHMSVRKNLAFPLKVAGVPRTEIKQRVEKIASLIGLGDRLDSRPGQLSGGQRQRVALGRAVIREPSIFLLDEPLSNLDAELRIRMRQEIVRIQREVGKTMVHVTHDQAEALTMGDRIALLNDGRIEQLGSPEDLYRRPVNRFVAAFVGQPHINFVDATVTRGEVTPFHVPAIGGIAAKASIPITVGIRPEAIRIESGAPLAGRVETCEYVGDSYVVTLDFNKTSLVASNVQKAVPAGEQVSFRVDPEGVVYFNRETGRNLFERGSL
jgi:multiple sugar transport system ATP-binding protein